MSVLFALGMTQCGTSVTDDKLARADSLAESAPSEALRLIDSLRTTVSADRKTNMRLALMEMKVKNRLRMPLDSDTLALLDKYYTGRGAGNERMLIKYIIACSYLDRYDAPMALEYFHEAAEQADTTLEDCDYRTLHKIHVQAAQLLMQQDALYDARRENEQALKYALKAKDTLNALITLEQKVNILTKGHESDSITINMRKRLSSLYMKHGYVKQGVTASAPVANYLIERGLLSEAKKYLDEYREKSGLFDTSGNIAKGREIHYVIEGDYYAEAGLPDSAEFYYRKVIRISKSFNDIGAACLGLRTLYKKLHVPDSVAKYADLARQMNDSIYARMTTRHLQQMQAMYNYNQFKLMAEEEKKNAANARLINVIVIFVSVFAITCMVLGLRAYIMKRKRIREKEIQRYEETVAKLIKTQREYNILNENQQMKIKSLLEEKNKEMEQLKQELQQREIKFNATGCEMFANTEIVKTLKRHAKEDLKNMSANEKRELKALFADYTPLSCWESRLSSNDYLVCLLVKIGFIPGEISILTGLSVSNISNIRKRLLMKMTGREGSAKDFDKYIRSL